MNMPDTPHEAFKFALLLAISAPGLEEMVMVLEMASVIAQDLTDSDIDTIKEDIEQMSNSERAQYLDITFNEYAELQDQQTIVWN